jgi:hypothetical protein
MARPRQRDLFEGESPVERSETDLSPPSYRPDLVQVRARLHKILAEARAAEQLPWDADRVLLYKTIFPHMAGWLPAEEAAQLRREFDAEMARLASA